MTTAITTGRRYPVAVMARAQVHVAHGWSPGRTAELLEAEFGIKPARQTIDYWTKPKTRQRVLNYVATRQEQGRGRRAYTSEAWRMNRMRELRAGGLTFSAIGVVAGVWWGLPLTAAQVRYRLRDESQNTANCENAAA